MITTVPVPDESVLAHKQLTVRPIGTMKLKHLRAYQRVAAAGKAADMDDLALALEGALDGWTPDEIGELTLDEMLLVVHALGAPLADALPNANGSNSSPPQP